MVISARNSPEFNFMRWKRAVGLPPTFPELSELAEDELDPDVGLYLGPPHEHAIEEILDSAQNPRVAVLVNDGQGCTTLSRDIYKLSAQSAVRMARIPVRVALDDFDPNESDLHDTLIEMMRAGIVRSLVLQSWERVAKRPYADLIGAVGRSNTSLESQRLAIAAAVGVVVVPSWAPMAHWKTGSDSKPDWDEVNELSKKLGLPIDLLLMELNKSFKVSISLQIDLSSTRYRDADGQHKPEYHRIIRRLSSATKALIERDPERARASTRGAPSNGHAPTLTANRIVNVMLFTSQEILDTFTSEWDLPFDELEYPQYGPVDVFGILAYHYPQKASTLGYLRQQSLALVISDELVHQVWHQNKSIKQIIDDLKTKILGVMQDWDRVTMRLTA